MFYRRPMFVGLATAAAVLALVYGLDRAGLLPWVRNDTKGSSSAVAWGWARSARSLPADPVLRTMTSWRTLRTSGPMTGPRSRPDLARRLGEFRVGCSLLLLDPHEPLKKHEGEEDWLVNRCRRWAARLDELMATTDAGEEPVDKLRAEADELVRRVTLRSHDPGPTTYVPWKSG